MHLLVAEFIEWWRDVIDGNRIITKSENTIKTTKSKSQTRLFGGFGKELVFDLHAGKLEGVRADETGKTATAISNFEFSAVSLVCRRRRRVVFGVQEASDGGTLGRRDPEI